MTRCSRIIDIVMVVLLPLLMAYSLIGENVHEVLGICMFALFIAHHAINRKWWTGLFKGKYSAARILTTAVNLFLAMFMFLQPVSGLLMSKYVLKTMTIAGAAGILRTIHMTFAYWGFIVMSFHLGLHVRRILTPFGRRGTRPVRIAGMILFLLIAAYGVYAFLKRGIGNYLLMRVRFAFFDFGESSVRFLLDYAAIMALIAGIACWVQTGLIRMGKNRDMGIEVSKRKTQGGNTR